MNIKKYLKDALGCIDNNSKNSAELLKLKVRLALKLEKMVKVEANAFEVVPGRCS